VAYSYPILLDLTGKLVVIVGGGIVALRKAQGVLEAGASKIKCVAPHIVSQMPGERIEAQFEPRHLDGAYLVFAATNSPQTNFDVVRAAHERKILVSRADDDDHGDFILPANLRNGPVIVSVSTGSPTLSRSLRDDIQSSFNTITTYVQMAELMQKLRPWLLSSSLEADRQHKALSDLASKAGLDALKNGGGEGLYRWLVEKYPELKLEKAP